MRTNDVSDGSPPAERGSGSRANATRRRLLACLSAGTVSGLAGCAALGGDDTPRDLQFERLQTTAVYVDEDADLSMPEEVETVGAPTNADLLVLPGDTDVGAERAVDWLAADRVLALLGEAAEPTWLSWARSDVYRDAFEGEGVADGDPDPQLLVAGTVGLHVPTYRRTWSDGPRERDVIRALDETLADLASRTPRGTTD